MQTRKLVATTLVHGLAAISLSAAISAGELPKEGSFDIMSCASGTTSVISFSKTHTATISEITGVSLSNPPGGLYDKGTYRCISLSSNFDGKVVGRSVCEGLDPEDGSKRLVVTTNQDGKVTREFIAGTGKYEGLVEVTANLQNVGGLSAIKPGTTQGCGRSTGTYKMK